MLALKLPLLAACLLLAAALVLPALATDRPADDPEPHRLTIQSLLAELADLRRLAEFPEPAFTTGQFSSYDRRSVSPDDATTEGWFANNDHGQFIREEERDGRTEYVMMEADGPGAIVRIWSANPRGTLRIYLDGNDEPAVEAAMHTFMGYSPAPYPISGVRGRGFNLYLPIPYAESCKITTDEGRGLYYLINYRTYKADVEVETYTDAKLREIFGPSIWPAAFAIDWPQKQGVEPDDEHDFERRIAPGDTVILADLDGGGAVCLFQILAGFDGSEADTADVENGEPTIVDRGLRALVLRMTFDGEQTVEAPLGDFFGAAPGINPYHSLPLSVEDSGRMTSRWVMPYRESAKIEIRNLGEAAATVTGRVGTVDYDWTDRTMHFHAGYRAAFDQHTRPFRDWNYLTVRGKGVFVGCSLAIDNPTVAWWGEGDEKIYVDGEDFPSWFGTGTEDYFGYAWCYNRVFYHAYHNQPRVDGPRNYGRASNNRFHITDRIPFNESFVFDMELWHWAEVDVNQAVVSYWYARPGAEHDFDPIGEEDVRVRPMPPHRP